MGITDTGLFLRCRHSLKRIPAPNQGALSTDLQTCCSSRYTAGPTSRLEDCNNYAVELELWPETNNASYQICHSGGSGSRPPTGVQQAAGSTISERKQLGFYIPATAADITTTATSTSTCSRTSTSTSVRQ